MNSNHQQGGRGSGRGGGRGIEEVDEEVVKVHHPYIL